ncbi:MAG: galactose mutarotase [Clostridiales bacterium]|jgi:aldose 1-epimerase|nr:galactose mutarotase [Clostridiales bacterium]
MYIEQKNFGYLSNGDEVILYKLSNSNGITVDIISLGGIIKSIVLPDKNKELADVVLGQDSLTDYLTRPACSGAIIGRCANRISGGAYTYNDKVIELEKNYGSDTLHSASGCYAMKNFVGETFIEADRIGVILYLKDDGEGGFPGCVELWVTYSLDKEGRLSIHYKAVPSEDTVINITNHAYFNLAGDSSGPINNHILKLEADYYLPNDKRGMPTGEILKVNKTPLDFIDEKPIGREINSVYTQIALFGGYDHSYCIRGRGLRKAATVMHKESGRTMVVYTDLPALQFYTANMLPENFLGKNGAVYKRHQGFCLETQHYPNAVNYSQFPSPFYKAGEVFDSQTIFRFFVKE